MLILMLLLQAPAAPQRPPQLTQFLQHSVGFDAQQISAVERPTLAEMPTQPGPQQEPSHSAALIAKARSYIDTNYSNPDISLSLVAAQVLLSPTYFSVMFGREVGETFIEYLTNVRIRRAMELLSTTSLTSSEIAYQIGYHNPRYFYSVFRKVVGLPPNEFRRRV